MSEAWQTAWAVARSGWLSIYNRSWRFARLKSGAIMLVFQLLMVMAVARRTPAAAGGAGFQGMVVLIAAQMALFGLFQGYSRGQMQLFQGILVPLFQVSPARPISFLVGRVIESVPLRAWSCLLWAWAYSAAVPGPARAGALLGLAAAGLVAGMLAHLAGLLTLTLVSRLAPRSLMAGTLAGFVVFLGLATWATIYLAQGGTVTDLALILRAYRLPVLGAVGLLLGIPGVVLLLALLLWPARVEDLYRVGLYQVLEVQERADARPRRSRWLPLPDGAFRGILSKEWIMDARSAFTRIRGLVWLAASVGVWFAGNSARGLGLQSAVLTVGAVSVLAWGLSFSGNVAIALTQERVTQLLYRLAGVPAGTLLAAKFVSLWVPSALGVAVPALVGGWRAGLAPAGLAGLVAWVVAAVTAGILGGLGVSAMTAGDEMADPEMLAGPRRMFGGGAAAQAGPADIWPLVRLLGLTAPPALVMWLGAGQPWTPFKLPAAPVGVVVGALALGAMALGHRLLDRDFRAPPGRVRLRTPRPAAARGE